MIYLIALLAEHHFLGKPDVSLFVVGKGVENIDIDLKSQQVSVTSSLSSEELLEVIKKTGKNTTYIGEKS